MKTELSTAEIERKLKIAEGLFNLAYTTKSFQLRQKHPELNPIEVHNMVIELIDRGCR